MNPDWSIRDLISTDALWIVGVAAMTNAACALLGCYLLLRRMSLLGDALSHAVLPGLVLAFLVGGKLSIAWMFVGAWCMGLLTTLLVETLERQGGVNADTSLGVVFTSLFALGVALLSRFANNVHLDTDCVLFGLLELVPLNLIGIGSVAVPRAAATIAPVLVADVLFVLLFWKELKLAAFDAGLATTLGFSAGLLHYLLMAMVATTAVASFEAVGSILVVAMLIAPPATAHLLCDRLDRLVMIAVVDGVLAAVLGFALASWIDVNTAGMIAVVAGAQYALALLLAPRYGILSQLAQQARNAQRILREDILSMLYRLEELAIGRTLGIGETVQAVGGRLRAHWAIWTLLRRREIQWVERGLRLTDNGRRAATTLVRAHRLWEAFLYEKLGLPLDHLHDPATRMEHYVGPQLQCELQAALGDVPTDPHGREVPPEGSAGTR